MQRHITIFLQVMLFISMMCFVISRLMMPSSVTFQSLAPHTLSHHFKHSELMQNCFHLKKIWSVNGSTYFRINHFPKLNSGNVNNLNSCVRIYSVKPASAWFRKSQSRTVHGSSSPSSSTAGAPLLHPAQLPMLPRQGFTLQEN